jgi:hypothetical protein
MNEIWRDVKGYEGVYIVSNMGNVRRVGRHSNQFTSWDNARELKKSDNGKGYFFVTLSMNNMQKRPYVHRLVAEAFIDNPENKPTVNHKDGVKSNNCVENLEWATYTENNVHSIEVLKRDTKNSSDSYTVCQFDKAGNFIKEYPSMREAERQTGLKAISQVCRGKKYHHTAGGYVWKYKKDIVKSVETIESKRESVTGFFFSE